MLNGLPHRRRMPKMKLKRIQGMIGIAFLMGMILQIGIVCADCSSREPAQPYEIFDNGVNSSPALQLPPPFNDPEKRHAVEPPTPRMIDPNSGGDQRIVNYDAFTGEVRVISPGQAIPESPDSGTYEGFQGSYKDNPIRAKIPQFYQSSTSSFGPHDRTQVITG